MSIYLDHAATSYVAPEVLSAMMPYYTEIYGNPNSRHEQGKQAKMAVDKARQGLADILNCKASEIIFTSGGTESNNLAILGIARAAKFHGKNHIITTQVEHSSILAPCEQLEIEGFEVTYLAVNEEGFIDLEELKNAIKKETCLVSIIYANNEIGTLQDVAKIGKICQKARVPFHTDACQAANTETLDTQVLNVDFMTVNSSKIYGPKGVGALKINKSVSIKPIIFGGKHEQGLRAGTLNTPGIVGMAKALEIAQKNKSSEKDRLRKLQEKIIDFAEEKIPHSHLNGPKENRLPNNISLSFENIDNSQLLLHLNEAGIYVSAKAACGTDNSTPSQVLRSIKLPKQLIMGTIRISLGRSTTEEEIDYLLKTLKNTLAKLRS